ncbi:MAG: hypothetical protein Q8R44_06290 [Novosphingobium sp.]|nr:hypothetical protein [Novosphingobium sp.]
MSVWLTSHEMASLNRALAKRTGARVRVGPELITVAQGIALWNAAAAFGEGLPSGSLPVSRGRNSRFPSGRERSLFRRGLGAGAVLAASVSLGGCTSLGGNIQGNFSCRAPDGICAPTSTIDDAALALIGGDESVIPAGPYSAPPSDTPRMIRTSASEPVRSGEKVLRIVFPAHIDRAGRYRETTAIHAVVERAVWTNASAAPAARTSTMTLQEPLEQLADGPVRSLGELASAAPEVRFPDPVANPVRLSRMSSRRRVRADLAAAPSAGSSSANASSTMAAVSYSLPPQTVGGASNPLESIRAQVAERLRASPVAGPPVAAAPGEAPSVKSPSQAAGTAATNRPSLFPVSGVNP